MSKSGIIGNPIDVYHCVTEPFVYTAEQAGPPTYWASHSKLSFPVPK